MTPDNYTSAPDAILAEIRTLEAQVRMAQRAHALDHEQRRAAQPGPGGRFRVGYRPMAALVDSVMPVGPR